MLNTESQALRQAMAAAKTGSELNTLAAALAAADRAAIARRQADADLDWASTAVTATLTPVAVHTLHTAASDWLGDIPEGSRPHQIIAEATLWYTHLPTAVMADREEFMAQARGAAARTAGRLQMHPAVVVEPFLDYVSFLHKRAGSGLPQIQQTMDADNAPAPTGLPPQVFDNFAPEVDPINAGVAGTETSLRAPVIQELIGGATPPAGPAAGPQTAAPDTYPDVAEADSDDGPLTRSMAVNHLYNLGQYLQATGAISEMDYDDDLFGPGNDPDEERDHHMDEMRRRAEIPMDAEKWHKQRRDHELEYAMQTHLDAAQEYGQDYANRHHPLPLPYVRTGASGLDQIQQTTAPNGETSRPTPLPQDVAFPWILSPDQENPAPPADGEMAQGMQAPAVLTTGEAAYGRTARAVTADQWHGQEWPHAAVQPDAANNAGTTPAPPTGGAAAGYAAGTADRAATDTAPTYADASSAAPDYARAYAEGYSSAPTPPRPVDENHPGMSGPPAQRLSHLMSTVAERANPDYATGYRRGCTWKAGGSVPQFGSEAYEAGLYAGLLDNPGAQEAFTERHRLAAAAGDNPAAGRRIAKHARASAYFLNGAALPDGVVEHGPYLRRTAATSTDLDTMAPGTGADPTGSTPFNGPGRPPLLDGQYGAADPAGPAPYNGAPPYGAPAVPTGADPAGQSATVPDTGMTTPNRATAFRRTMQANLARAAAGAPLLTIADPEGSQ